MRSHGISSLTFLFENCHKRVETLLSKNVIGNMSSLTEFRSKKLSRGRKKLVLPDRKKYKSFPWKKNAWRAFKNYETYF